MTQRPQPPYPDYSEKDARGVPLMRGRWAIPSRSLVAFSVLCVVASVGFILYSHLVAGRNDGFLWAPFRAFLNALTFGLLPALWCARTILLRREILRLTPAEVLASELGTDPDTLERLAEERGVKPRYNINGADYYDPRDFGDSALLLRAAARPEETLLQPASAAPSEEALLLRAREES